MSLLARRQTPAESWQVDVAAELEAYLSRLSQQEENYDDAQELNFAEAALLLQNSTSVYSKKVEYLAVLAQDTLLQITTRKAAAQGVHAKGGARAKKSGALEWEASDLFTIPWNIVVPCKDEETTTKYVTTQLEPATVYERLFVPQPGAPRLPLLLMPRDDAKDTKIGQGVLHSRSGAVLADAQDLKTYEFELAEMSDRSCFLERSRLTTAAAASAALPSVLATPGQGPATMMSAVQQTPSYTAACPSAQGGPGTAVAGPGTAVAGSRLDWGNRNRTPADDEQQAGDHHHGGDESGPDRTDEKKKDAKNTDPLEPLDCHAPQGKDRPLRVGKPFREPRPKIYNLTASEASLLQLQVVGSLALNGSLYNEGSGGGCDTLPGFPDIRLPPAGPVSKHFGRVWRAFDRQYASQSRKIFGVKAAGRAVGGSTEIGGGSGDVSENGAAWEAEAGEGVATDVAVEGDPLTMDDGPEEQPQHALPSAIAQNLAGDLLLNSIVPLAPTMTCLLLSSEQNEMYRRMACWKDSVAKWTKVAAARPVFNVADYRQTLARRIDQQQRLQQTPSEGPGVAVAEFNDLVKADTRFDVCRYFLTALMMCNEKQIGIEPCAEGDSLKLTLLTPVEEIIERSCNIDQKIDEERGEVGSATKRARKFNTEEQSN